MNVIEVDGRMCEDIRIGIEAWRAYGGKGYRIKDPNASCRISMAFSSTLLEIAGGFRRFLEEWEEDPSW